jgi:hypothetical protein
MAGDIKSKYGSLNTFTVTNLHSLASSSTREAGWTSASVANTSDLSLDYIISGTFTTHASNRQAGFIDVRVYSALNAAVTWPDLFSSGTEGTEGAATFHDTEQMISGSRLLTTIEVDNGASDVMTFPQLGIAALFRGILPTNFALFVGQNAATSTNAGLAAAGSALFGIPVLSQYT